MRVSSLRRKEDKLEMIMTVEAVQRRKMKNERIRNRFSGGKSGMRQF